VQLSTLRVIELSQTVTNATELRKLPALEYLSYKFDLAKGRPAQTAQEFWDEFDYKPAPINSDSVLATAGLTGAAGEVLRLWTGGERAKAVEAYRAFARTGPPKETLTQLHRRFASAEWSVTWFPSRGLDPETKLDLWRAEAHGASAVTIRTPLLDFDYRMSGPRQLRLHPDLTQRGPDAQDFGMIAQGQLTLPTGKWRIALTSDDGSRLIINGKLLIEQWAHQHSKTIRADWEQKSAAPLNVTVEHFQQDGAARLKLSVEPVQ
jgi:hypothetical protein